MTDLLLSEFLHKVIFSLTFSICICLSLPNIKITKYRPLENNFRIKDQNVKYSVISSKILYLGRFIQNTSTKMFSVILYDVSYILFSFYCNIKVRLKKKHPAHKMRNKNIIILYYNLKLN